MGLVAFVSPYSIGRLGKDGFAFCSWPGQRGLTTRRKAADDIQGATAPGFHSVQAKSLDSAGLGNWLGERNVAMRVCTSCDKMFFGLL